MIIFRKPVSAFRFMPLAQNASFGRHCKFTRPAGLPQRSRTLRNCHGSDVSMSSANKPGRPVSGVQSV